MCRSLVRFKRDCLALRRLVHAINKTVRVIVPELWLRTKRPKKRSSYPRRGTRFVSAGKRRDWLKGPHSPLFHGYLQIFFRGRGTVA